MIEHLVGMQSQVPTSPYTGLWSRIAGFAADDLARLYAERRVARIALLRSTVHLVTADDCLWIRPVVQPVIESPTFLAGLDHERIAATARAAVETEPRTPGELADLLAELAPSRPRDELGRIARALLPLVQVPPRGVWRKGGAVRLTTAESWLGRPLAVDASVDELVLRYLRAFGPASVQDATAWSRLTRMRPVFERLRPKLRTYRDENGIELFDLAERPLPDPGAPAPVRFLPEYDNVMLGHADRSRVLAPEHRAAIATQNGYLPTVLVDGFVAAAWAFDGASVSVTPLVALSKRDRAAVDDEAARLSAFLSG
jgi:hypothetical protein